MAASRRPNPSQHLPDRPAARAIVDHGFIPIRARLIDVAAFLDRVERYAVADDFRCVSLRQAAALLVDGKSERARRILEKLSDPTSAPETVSSGKAAVGAWQPAGKAGKPKAGKPRARRR